MIQELESEVTERQLQSDTQEYNERMDAQDQSIDVKVSILPVR